MAIISEAGLGIFKDIFNTAIGIAKDTKNDYKQEKKKIRSNSMNSLNRSSIMRASKDLVMTFPVLCTDTIQPSTASMIVKAIERNCVTTLQLLFASANLSGENGLDAISKWHTNFDNDMDIDEYIDAMDALASTTANIYRNRGIIKDEFNDIKKKMMKECADNNQYFPESSFSKSSISCFLVENSTADHMHIIKEADYDNPYMDPNFVFDQYDDNWKTRQQEDADYDYLKYKLDKQKAADEKQNQANRNANERERDRRNFQQREDQFNKKMKYQKQSDQRRNDFTRQQLNMQQQQMNNQYDIQKQQLDLQRQQMDNQQLQNDRMYQQQVDNYNRQLEKDKFDMYNKTLQTRRELFQKQLLDSDVKKCNELVPSMMIVNYIAPDPTGMEKDAIEKEFIAGVKARLISCSSNEIIDRVKSIQKNKPNMLNLVRATTKEISFAKDFVAGIEQAKIDAKGNSKLSKNSAIWRSLQARSTKSGMNRLKRNRANDAGAITTLVVSDEEVNYLIKSDGINLNIPATAKSIMEAYNLMGFVIVDEQTEVAKFLFDGDKYFQEYAFNTLERETGDNSYKKVVNLLSRNIK